MGKMNELNIDILNLRDAIHAVADKWNITPLEVIEYIGIPAEADPDV